MPRSNRPKGRKGKSSGPADEEIDLAALTTGWRHTESRRGIAWNVQPVSALQAVKTYLCPGCGLEVLPGNAHVVVWRADGILGDEADIADRRHWHSHCWKIGSFGGRS